MTVTTTRAKAAARRAGPRLARLAVRGYRNADGALTALVYAAKTSLLRVFVATIASPRWSEVAAGLGAGVRARLVTIAGLALLGLTWLASGSWVVWIVGAPAGAWVAARATLAVYPLTRRGRVRTRHGHDGFLTCWDWWRFLSPAATRRAAVTLRPSIERDLPAVDETAGVGAVAGQRARRHAIIDRLPVTATGTWVGTTAVGPMIGLNCWVTHRDTVGILGAPGCGKTGLLASQLIDHDGPAVATSTKPDLLAITGALRAQRA